MQTRTLLPLILALCSHGAAQSGGISAPAEPRIHFVRSVSGSSGSEQNGRYIVSDPRSIFYVPSDKHVVVYFEWDGPVGPHHFEGYWKNPEGKVVVISDFSFDSRQKRFGGYWTLDLTESIKTGMWALEARVDGELAGTHTLQILAGDKVPSVAAARTLLGPSDIYKRAVAATVTVENLDEKKQRVSTGLGFFLHDGYIVTAFQVIDSASVLRVRLPSGEAFETSEVGAWNRLQDWAVLKVPGSAPAKLESAKPRSWSVGDRCFSLDVPTESSRVIVDESITGAQSFPEFGDRFNVSSVPHGPAMGAPVLNEYGDVIGVLGGTVFPGARRLDAAMFTVAGLREGGMATPIELVAATSAEGNDKSLADLRAMGLFVDPVRKSDLLSGVLGDHFEVKKDELPSWREGRTEFSRANGHCEVLLVWNPRSKIRGELTMVVYDIKNRPVVRSKPGKIRADPGQFVTSRWEIELANLKSSAYRVDVLQDEKPVWRTFFRLTD